MCRQKRTQVRCEENRHGPTTRAGHGNGSLHIYSIYIRTFFPIHLDADKFLIHQSSSFRIFETFFPHAVAPVAGSITDTQKDGLIFSFSFTQCFFSPRVPFHRIISMLKQVKRVF